MSTIFSLHDRYSRQQIHDQVGGDLQSYLPHSGGKVVCGCFDPSLNARAPFEIDVGNLPEVIKYAERFAKQVDPIPVFLKRNRSEWEFVGDFVAERMTKETSDLYPAKTNRRPDAVAVLYLTEVCAELRSQEESVIPVGMEAEEGKRVLRAHLARERSAVLAEAKRRACRVEHGRLECEACGLSESGLPSSLADSCFEVHHIAPLGKTHQPVRTGLADLALVCANCHRMIHRSNPMVSPQELAQVLRGDA